MMYRYFSLILCCLLACFANAQCWQSADGGTAYNLAIKQDGSLWAWGDNSSGQLGLGNNNTYYSPAQVGNQSGWSQVSAGVNHSLALKTNGTLWAWGNNSAGALGFDLGTSTLNTPTQVGTDNNWVQIATGLSFSLGIKSDGSLWAWGSNNYGQCGVSSSASSIVTPTRIGTANNWSKITAGYYHAIAIKSDGTMWAWGRNHVGQLGSGNTSTTAVTAPIQVGSSTDWRSVSAGEGHNVALKTNNTVWCWGWNGYGQIGTGNNIDVTAPYQVSTSTSWAFAVAGDRHTLAALSNGNLWGWGNNAYSQIAATSTTVYTSPIQTSSGTTPWSLLTAGGYHNICILNSGAMWTAGANTNGQLGIGNSFVVYQAFTGLSCPSTILPVTFLNFTGTNMETYNQLIWTTYNETNNKGFEIQKSLDGRAFDYLGFIKAEINRGQVYQYSDYGFVSSPTYYRLKQIDYDGQTSYSNIISISPNKDKTYSLYPIPANDYLMVKGKAINTTNTNIYNQLGAKQVLNLQGNRINIQTLLPGTYTLIITDDTGTSILKFIKQ